VLEKMPTWAVRGNTIRPYNTPVSWRPYVTSNGEYQGFEVNPSWFLQMTSLVSGLMTDAILNSQPVLRQVVTEVPSPRSPLQMVSPEAAKIFAERILGARLPTPREWEEVLKVAGKPVAANFRGPNFQELFNFLRDYKTEDGVTIPWRPNEGTFRPRERVDGRLVPAPDDGRSSEDRDESRFWFTSVDEGPATGKFINLTGNVSIFLHDGTTPYVAGGSVLSPPGVDFTKPQPVQGSNVIGARSGTEAYADVGIRPAFEAPPGFKERFKLLELVRKQGFLTW